MMEQALAYVLSSQSNPAEADRLLRGLVEKLHFEYGCDTGSVVIPARDSDEAHSLAVRSGGRVVVRFSTPWEADT